MKEETKCTYDVASGKWKAVRELAIDSKRIKEINKLNDNMFNKNEAIKAIDV